MRNADKPEPIRRPRGQPSSIDRVVDRNPDGSDVTAASRITQLVRAGNYLETAAQSTDVSKVSAYEWLKHGARVRTAIIAAEDKGQPTPATSEYDRKCVEFSNAITKAAATSIAEDVALTHRLARGGQSATITTETTKTLADGTVETTTTTRTEQTPPNERVLLWRLERRAPHLWGRMDRLEVTGEDGGPVAIQVTDSLADELVALAGRITVEDLTEPPVPLNP